MRCVWPLTVRNRGSMSSNAVAGHRCFWSAFGHQVTLPVRPAANAFRFSMQWVVGTTRLRLAPDETEFTGPGSITVTGTTREAKHLKLEDPGLNTLSDGRYGVLFRDLRDEIGNFTDADANPVNGIQPVEFSLEIW